MDPTPARYVIWINGHAGATVLSGFPALAWQRHGAAWLAATGRGNRA
jgi:hypothetical protein